MVRFREHGQGENQSTTELTEKAAREIVRAISFVERCYKRSGIRDDLQRP